MTTLISNSFEASKKQLSAYLKDLGVRRAVVEFAGGGDSGQIDSVSFYTKSEEESVKDWANVGGDATYAERLKEAGHVEFDEEQTLRFFSGDSGQLEVMTVTKAAEHLAYAALSATGLDWYNNDGGQGQITLDTETCDVTVAMGINITTTEDYSFEF